MLDKIASFYGFSKMPFGRDIAPGQLHRHHGHAEAVARLTWAITTRSLAVLTGEVGSGKPRPCAPPWPGRPGSLPARLPAQPGRHRHPRHLPADRHRLRPGARFHTGSLLPQAADALATEAEERGRPPS